MSIKLKVAPNDLNAFTVASFGITLSPMLEWVDPISTPTIVTPFSVSSKKIYINNNDRTAHFVGRSKLTSLDIVKFYKIKQKNENMETEMKEMEKN